MEHIVEQNYDSKILEMQNLMRLWSCRKLTVLGRITVLKTLIMPKLTHLLIALPNPNQKMIKQINTLFFNFIWENKTEKFKHNLITQN